MRSQPLLLRPGVLLRVEAFLVLCVSCVTYGRLFPQHWGLFACLFLVPDVSLIPYIRGPRIGASVLYNFSHSYLLPVLLGTVGLYFGRAFLEEASLAWLGHIGLDRALGYGLKHPTSFAFTHIQSAAYAGPQDGRLLPNREF